MSATSPTDPTPDPTPDSGLEGVQDEAKGLSVADGTPTSDEATETAPAPSAAKAPRHATPVAHPQPVAEPVPPDDAILPEPLPRAGRPLALTMLLYSLAVVLLITLAPFRFELERTLEWQFATSGFDIASNFALFLLPGFLFRAWMGSNRDLYCVGPFLAGLAFSLVAELGQSYLVGRISSPLDLMTNAGGAWFGAMAYDAARRNLDLALAGRLALEIPLTGVVYLLVPLIWLNGLAGEGHVERMALGIIPGALGGMVLASIWAHRLRRVGLLSPLGIGLVAGLWFSLSSVPLMARAPGVYGVGVTLIVLLTSVTAVLLGHPRADRRFELPTLRRIAPAFLAYLLLAGTWPWTGPAVAFRMDVWIPDFSAALEQREVLSLLEHVSAFALGGYMIAEARGREDESGRSTLLITLLVALVPALALEFVRGIQPASHASVLRAGFAVAAAQVGAVVGLSQISAIKRWLELARQRPRTKVAKPLPSGPGFDPIDPLSMVSNEATSDERPAARR